MSSLGGRRLDLDDRPGGDGRPRGTAVLWGTAVGLGIPSSGGRPLDLEYRPLGDGRCL
jgi:hypothetical protein